MSDLPTKGHILTIADRLRIYDYVSDYILKDIGKTKLACIDKTKFNLSYGDYVIIKVKKIKDRFVAVKDVTSSEDFSFSTRSRTMLEILNPAPRAARGWSSSPSRVINTPRPAITASMERSMMTSNNSCSGLCPASSRPARINACICGLL